MRGYHLIMMSPMLLWTILGWALGVGAIVALALALAGRLMQPRVRPMRRCPKCWYDLSHSPGMTCSECGFTARREKQFFKMRRRKRWVLAAVVLWGGSYYAFRVPDVQQRGWVAAVPTTVLVFLWPEERVDSFTAAIHADPQMLSNTYSVPDSLLSEELAGRLARGELFRWQWRLLVDIAVRSANQRTVVPDEIGTTSAAEIFLSCANRENRLNDKEVLRKVLTAGLMKMSSRPRWPEGEDVYVWAWTHPMLTDLTSPSGQSGRHIDVTAVSMIAGIRSLDARDIHFRNRFEFGFFSRGFLTCGYGMDSLCFPWDDKVCAIGRPSEPVQKIKFETIVDRRLTNAHAEILGQYRLHAKFPFEFDCEVGGTIDDILTPVRNAEFDLQMTSRLRPMVHQSHVHLSLGDVYDLLELLDGVTFAVSVELMREGRAIASGEAWWAILTESTMGGNTTFLGPSGDYVPLELADSYSKPRVVQECRLRITPNPQIALRRFDSDRYWDGVIEVPVGIGW